MMEPENEQCELRLVVVDDHEFAREAVASALDGEPGLSTVGQAGSVAEALAVIKRVRPDVVVLDLNLPDGTGRDVLTSFATRTDVVFVVYTAALAQLEADELKTLGASEVILKSLRGNGLVEAIRQAGEALSNTAGRSISEH